VETFPLEIKLIENFQKLSKNLISSRIESILPAN